MPCDSEQSSPLATNNKVLRPGLLHPRGRWGKKIACLSAIGAFTWGACRPTPPVPRADETPDREFILERLSLEERRDGNLMWTGRAARGAGDLGTSDVVDLNLVRLPQTPTESPLHIEAHTAHLGLAGGQAHFAPVLAYDELGRRLEGSAANYDEATGRLEASGPIHLTAPHTRIDATRATLDVHAGYLVLEGPILGQVVMP